MSEPAVVKEILHRRDLDKSALVYAPVAKVLPSPSHLLGGRRRGPISSSHPALLRGRPWETIVFPVLSLRTHSNNGWQGLDQRQAESVYI